jgi:hypothetical protein
MGSKVVIYIGNYEYAGYKNGSLTGSTTASATARPGQNDGAVIGRILRYHGETISTYKLNKTT